MGDIYDQHEALADMYGMDAAMAAAVAADAFDTPDQDGAPEAEAQPKRVDPARPKAVRGRYTLPDPENGKPKSWQQVTNFIKLVDDTYHLELWKQRNVAKGVAMRPDLVNDILPLDVKRDRDRLDRIVERALAVAGAYKMSDAGTAMHASTELADYAGGSLRNVSPEHRPRVQMYLDVLRVNGLTVVPDMIERVTVSQRYDVAGKFDRILQMSDGSYVVGDLKCGDSLELSFPSIAGQLACYQDGINQTGVWDGARYDQRVKVREDFGIVVHLPSTRDEVTLYRVDLSQGHILNSACLEVRQARRIKARHVARVFRPEQYSTDVVDTDAVWLEVLNAAHTVKELISIAARARSFGQWTERLAGQARLLAAELTHAEAGKNV
jgi:hypothetical protein